MKPHSPFFPFALDARPLALAGLLALAGCAVGPDFAPPKVQTPPAWVDANQPANAASESRLAPSPITAVEWWTTFGDENLSKLVRDAAAQNLTVLEAEARISVSRAAITAADAGFFPSVTGTGAFSDGTTNKIVNGEPQQSASHGSLRSGLSGVWNLDIFGGTRRAAEAANASLEETVENRRDTLITVLAEIGADYIALRSEQQLLNIAHQSLADEQHTLKITQDRWQAGLASKLDYENAKSAADSTSAQIPSLEASIRTQIYALGLLLGRDPDALLGELGTAAPLPKTPSEIPIGLPADLLRRRPDIRAAEAQLHADTANIGVAKSQYFPQFTLNGSFNFTGVSVGQMAQWAARSWSWGPSINWPIFAGGKIYAQVEQARATLQADLFAYHNTVLTALNQVETTLMDFNKEQERRAALRNVVDDNQQSYNLSLQLYTQGSVEFINVLSAELSLASSQNQLEQSDANIATDLVALFKALGGGWSAFPERDAVQLDNVDPSHPSPAMK